MEARRQPRQNVLDVERHLQFLQDLMDERQVGAEGDNLDAGDGDNLEVVVNVNPFEAGDRLDAGDNLDAEYGDAIVEEEYGAIVEEFHQEEEDGASVEDFPQQDQEDAMVEFHEEEEEDVVMESADEVSDGEGDDPNNHLNLLDRLSKAWVHQEIHHRVSKEGSNALWKLSNDMFHEMYVAKGDQGRKIPQMPHLRRKTYKTLLPPIKLKFGYQCKEDGVITVVDDVEQAPVSRFPPSTHRRLFEIAYVEVTTL